ncbi:MAG: hypothetical protein JNM18_03925 [Planctomycetaceae bacterium]|nr:hypothetical protein [Planctomycetaceae bacterium]
MINPYAPPIEDVTRAPEHPVELSLWRRLLGGYLFLLALGSGVYAIVIIGAICHSLYFYPPTEFRDLKTMFGFASSFVIASWFHLWLRSVVLRR